MLVHMAFVSEANICAIKCICNTTKIVLVSIGNVLAVAMSLAVLGTHTCYDK